jgi:hypothetical protein
MTACSLCLGYRALPHACFAHLIICGLARFISTRTAGKYIAVIEPSVTPPPRSFTTAVDQLLQTTKMLYAKVAQALPVSGRQDLVRTFFFRRHYWRSLADLHAQSVAAAGNVAQAVEENTQEAPYVLRLDAVTIDLLMKECRDWLV